MFDNDEGKAEEEKVDGDGKAKQNNINQATGDKILENGQKEKEKTGKLKMERTKDGGIIIGEEDLEKRGRKCGIVKVL